MENTIVDHSIFHCSCFIQYFPVLMKNTIVDHSIFHCSCFIQYFPVLMIPFNIFQCSWKILLIILFSSAHGFIQYFPVLMKNTIVDHSIFHCSCFIQYFPVLMENTIDHIIFQCSWFHSIFSSANEKYYC